MSDVPVKLPPLADQLRAEARRLRTEAERTRAALLAKADELDHTAAMLDGQAGEGLTTGSQRSNIRSKMQAATDQPRNVRIAAGHAARTKERPASEARRLLLAAGQTPSMVAKALKVGRSTVQAWLDGTRAISEPHIEAASKRWGIPRSAWPRIA